MNENHVRRRNRNHRSKVFVARGRILRILLDHSVSHQADDVIVLVWISDLDVRAIERGRVTRAPFTESPARIAGNNTTSHGIRQAAIRGLVIQCFSVNHTKYTEAICRIRWQTLAIVR